MPAYFFDLLAGKALFCRQTKALYIADMHLGKAGHFRQGGVPLPGGHTERDLQRLSRLIARYRSTIKQVIFLGDVFHSCQNSEWELFCRWRQHQEAISMILIKGNHDILPASAYRRAGLEVCPEGNKKGGIELRHHPKEHADASAVGGQAAVTFPAEAGADFVSIKISLEETESLYLCGHLHPGVELFGRGRQREQLACFWQRRNMLMLPAFGSFTGLHLIKPQQNDGIWGIADSEIVALHNA